MGKPIIVPKEGYLVIPSGVGTVKYKKYGNVLKRKPSRPYPTVPKQRMDRSVYNQKKSAESRRVHFLLLEKSIAETQVSLPHWVESTIADNVGVIKTATPLWVDIPSEPHRWGGRPTDRINSFPIPSEGYGGVGSGSPVPTVVSVPFQATAELPPIDGLIGCPVSKRAMRRHLARLRDARA